jgi:hypothetical protein
MNLTEINVQVLSHYNTEHHKQLKEEKLFKELRTAAQVILFAETT